MTQGFKLNIYGKCGGQKEDPRCICSDNNKPSDLEVKKVTNIEDVTSFTKYIHKLRNPGGRTFTLQRDLGNGGTIRSTVGTRVNSIENVTEVSVYYWNGNEATPILLGITTKDPKSGNTETKYYGRFGNSAGLSWFSSLVQNLKELQALDQQNCYNNKAVVFNLEGSQSGSFLDGVGSTCIKKTRKVSTVSNSASPPGSEYIAKSYIINDNDLDTKISRVTYKNQPTDIPLVDFPVDVITLYSYRASDQVPLMLEFRPSGGGTSSWFYSTNSNGKKWMEHGNGDSFYDGGSDPQPTVQLSEKLDEVLCKQYGNVTLDFSHIRHSGTYCCNEHSKKEGGGKVSVSEVQVFCAHRISSQITAYKHSLSGPSVAGIYYKDYATNNRRKISGLPFPMDGIDNIYVLYCNRNDPQEVGIRKMVMALFGDGLVVFTISNQIVLTTLNVDNERK
ncbi:hypothetical protein BEWA_045540 [Theileria equi strain WA]|uniref:Uncharacterized protein n=1 Tax=Theileria equi strain WA TaxID=1537102 RepID=L1LA36_THEEQ|nr:hypothetical protein BEWA_045540 [Theileria equi strain WA]EKX72090.1 hypothetical protein BEWA_045540 [Theileria equi strain WA]|eukprot:XP_004831542.1 hypothetical protein BEWA_045540 [Theileria equi strain WA]